MIVLDIDLLQLNDLYYAVAKHTKECKEIAITNDRTEYFINQLRRAEELETIVQDALHNRVAEMQDAIDYIDEVVEKYENEEETKDPYAGMSFTEQAEAEIDEALKNARFYPEQPTKKIRVSADEFEKAVNFSVHFVDNDEADEDAGFFNNKPNGVSQFILDFVEANGLVSYTEMNDMYKAYTGGSNSFSHILKALMIPYKNRESRRYLVKHPYGGYHVRLATPQDWVVVND